MLLLAVVALITVGPLGAVVLTAFMTPAQFARAGVGIPAPWTTENFEELSATPELILTPMLITLIVATIIAGMQTSSALLAAYVFARLEFPLRRTIFAIYLCSYLAPPVITFIPLYMAFARAGLLGTFWSLVIPFALASPYAILLLRQTLRAIPRELLDAAEVDGAGHARVLISIVAPIARPAIITVLLVAAVSTWNSYLWPRLAAGVHLPQTQVAIGAMQSQYDSNWTLVMAATLIAIVPPVAATLIAQRAVLRTLDLHGGIS